MQKILVAFHSQQARRTACHVALALGADVELITPARQRGLLRFFRSSIETPHHDPSQYDLVVLAAPLREVSDPVRAYLRCVGRRIQRLAVLATGEEECAREASRNVASVLGRSPIAEIVIHPHDHANGNALAKTSRFVGAIRLALSVSYAQTG